MSEDKPRSRGRRRFGFDGPVRRTREIDVSVDDILDSLSRRSGSGETRRSLSTPPIDEMEDIFAPSPSLTEAKSHLPLSLGKYVFGLLLLCGLLVAWLYGALRNMWSPSVVPRIVQSPALGIIFADPVKLGLLVLFCSIPAVIVRRHRAVRNRLMYV